MIKIFNNLNTVQSVRVKDRLGSYYTVFIEAKRSTDIEGYQVTQDLMTKINKGSIIDISGTLTLQKPIKCSESDCTVMNDIKTEATESDTTESVNNYEPNDLIPENDINVNDSPTESVHVCEICGYEFATERGLAMHKSKSHK